jgi:hypothetical protein
MNTSGNSLKTERIQIKNTMTVQSSPSRRSTNFLKVETSPAMFKMTSSQRGGSKYHT